MFLTTISPSCSSSPPFSYNVLQFAYVELLDLEFDFFIGKIPTEIGNAVRLQSIRFGMNLLSGAIPSEIGNMLNLTKLELQSNFLTGMVPTEVSMLPKLKNLNTTGNPIT